MGIHQSFPGRAGGLPFRASLWTFDESLLEEDFDLEEVLGCDMFALWSVEAMEQFGQKFVYRRVGGVTTSAQDATPSLLAVRAIWIKSV